MEQDRQDDGYCVVLLLLPALNLRCWECDLKSEPLTKQISTDVGSLSNVMSAILAVLGVFHGGGHLVNLVGIMGVAVDDAREIAAALIDVGVADAIDHDDPTLPLYLSGG